RNRLREILERQPGDAAIAPGFGQIRVERKRAIQIANGAFDFSLQQPHSATIAVEVRPLWRQRDGAVGIGDCGVQLAFPLLRQPAITPGASVARVQLERPVAIGDCRNYRALTITRAAAVAPGVGVARIELNGLIEVSNGRSEVALIESRRATVVPGSRVARVDLNGATVITDRRVAFALFNADGPTVHVSLGVPR